MSVSRVIWTVAYDSDFGPQAIDVEVALNPVLRAPRKAPVRQLIDDPIIGNYSGAYAWALDAAEARAEKVRAACTRNAMRDFYDLDQLMRAGFDVSSPEFIQLVDSRRRTRDSG